MHFVEVHCFGRASTRDCADEYGYPTAQKGLLLWTNCKLFVL